MIGEIRDLETAQIAVQASLTGHLVLATLHTNDAPGAVTRLIDMGIEPYLLASTLNGVLAQRLVRKLCPECKAPYEPDAVGARRLRQERRPTASTRPWAAAHATSPATAAAPASTSCSWPTTSCATASTTAPAESELREYAVRHGMTRLRDDGLRWVREGATSLDEVLRVTDLGGTRWTQMNRRLDRSARTLQHTRLQRRGQAPQGRAGGRQRAPGARARCATRGSRPIASRSSRPTTPRPDRALRPVSLSSAQLTQLTRGLASLLEAGLTIEQAFNALIEQAEKERCARSSRRCAARCSPATPSPRRSRRSPTSSRSSIARWWPRAKSSGQLPRVLSRLSDYLEERQQLRGQALARPHLSRPS